MTNPVVVHNLAANRFEVETDGLLSVLEYRVKDQSMLVTSTAVPAPVEGRGIGSSMVAAAVDYAAAQGLTLVPMCSFTHAWLQQHPDEAHHVNIEWPDL
jgi:predicted GNAT family acetyltransferase